MVELEPLMPGNRIVNYEKTLRECADIEADKE